MFLANTTECARIGYFCDGSQKENEENYIPQLKQSCLYEKMQNVLKQMSWHTKSLLQNMDSNRVETFNSVISKYTGGKRVNFGLRGSYEARCNAAVVNFNSHEPISRLSCAIGSKPGEIAIQLENRKKKILQAARGTRKCTQYYKRLATDKDYGPQAEKPDVTADEMNLRKAQHMVMLQHWQNKRIDIEKETREQAATGAWRYYRTKLLTASHFANICKMRESTSCASKVKAIVYPKEINAISLQYGRESEDIARQTIEREINIKIQRCGLFIDSKDSFLGASPDGLIEDDGIVEIVSVCSTISCTTRRDNSEYIESALII